MRRYLSILATLLFLLFFTVQTRAAEAEPAASLVDLKFSGYKLGQAPSANMVCLSGYCKSQGPDGDGLISFPYSTYGTPGAVSTLSGLMVVNPRYSFWNEQLYRISFQVDCTPLEMAECLDDIIVTLDREYDLIPISSSETQQFALARHIIVKEFATESGAIVKLRSVASAEGPQLPLVNIIDQDMANQVGTTLSPNFKPKQLKVPATGEGPGR